MKIAQVGTLWENIPPPLYGGTERIISFLTEGLVLRDHDVTLFAVGTSLTKAKLVSIYPRPLFRDGIERTNIMYPLLNITEAIDREKEFDIIHFHLSLASDYICLPLSESIKQKVVITPHFASPTIKGYPDRQKVLDKYKDLNYVSISNATRKGYEHLHWVDTVYNGINISEFNFNPDPEDYFVWIGKFNPDKGVREAILAAKATGVTLKIIGAIDNLDKIDYAYYHNEVKPFIDDKQIIYLGEKGGKEKDEILGKAKGFLNPVLWDEPFGLVAIEAMAAGTPVIAFRKGALPETVDDGKTGFIVETVDEMAKKIREIQTIDRRRCRQWVEEKFSAEIMVKNYEKVYEKVLQEA
jgi:glycosyltransferase involved in cell wall biosynthesis